MKLNGKVNKIERIVANSGRRGETSEEKRVFSLSVRLPDPSLQASYNYGYGSMNFILHGKQMEDFIDLGGECDVYVLRKGEADEVPQRTFHDMQATIYQLEGELTKAAQSLAAAKESQTQAQNNNNETRARLEGAMREAIRLTAENEALRAVRGQKPAEPAQLGYAQGGEARQGGDAEGGSVHEHPVPNGDAPESKPGDHP